MDNHWHVIIYDFLGRIGNHCAVPDKGRFVLRFEYLDWKRYYEQNIFPVYNFLNVVLIRSEQIQSHCLGIVRANKHLPTKIKTPETIYYRTLRTQML